MERERAKAQQTITKGNIMRGFTYQAIDSNKKVWVKSSQSKQFVLDEIKWWATRRGITLKLIQLKTKSK